MSDEQAMEIIENLSEELGEKELKIMALEKALEYEKGRKNDFIELCKIKQYKIEYMEAGCEHELWTPYWIITENTEEDDDLMIKVILHYFGGKIMHKSDIIKEYPDIDFEEEPCYYYTTGGAIPRGYIEDLDNDTGNFWLSETQLIM